MAARRASWTAMFAVLLLVVCACSAGRRAAEGEVEERTIGTFNSIPQPLPPEHPAA